MKRMACLTVVLLAMGCCAATAADADSRRPQRIDGAAGSLAGFGRGAAKAVADTIPILGPWSSGAAHNGQFETPGGAPAWNGWTSVDLRRDTTSVWHADTYNVVNGVYSAWCGESHYPSCHEFDPTGGYGNNYYEVLEWRGQVADAAQPCTVSVSAVVNHHTEPGYDYSYLSYRSGGVLTDLWVADDQASGVPVAAQFVVDPADYEGAGGDEIVIQFRVVSDGAFSDADCFWPTAGALQVDDVIIELSNGDGYATGFEDGTLGDFATVQVPGVGDFAALRGDLRDLDPCVENRSTQVTFIDDGVVVPGTGGTPCINWCYGPGGYIVNTTGGLSDDETEYIHNAVKSPVMAWPDPALSGCALSFGVYRDMPFGSSFPGMSYTWQVRSTASADAQDIDLAPWRDRNFLYFGDPRYERRTEFVGDLIVPGVRFVQVQLAVYEFGWRHGVVGHDGSPAPYFDNVRLAAHEEHGPVVFMKGEDPAVDAFPGGGVLDLVDLGANHVPFGSTRGDSVSVTALTNRPGAALTGPPQLHYKLRRNPLFDPHRSAGLPDEGQVAALPSSNASGTPIEDVWHAVLPDSGFLFPGDVLHWFFTASDAIGGDIGTATLPADTTGFSDFRDVQGYPEDFTVRALPSLREGPGGPGTIAQPPLLFWDDADAANRVPWYAALGDAGLQAGEDYDIYTTIGASRFAGSGPGRSTVAAQLAGYEDLLYSSGVFAFQTILPTGTNEVENSPDLLLIDAWLRQGGKDIFLTGDHLVEDLTNSAEGEAFLRDWMGVSLYGADITPLINGQMAPVVEVAADNPVVTSVESWLVPLTCRATSNTGGMGHVDQFLGRTTTLSPLEFTETNHHNAVVVLADAVSLASYRDPAGDPDSYIFSAAALREDAAHDARVITLPYDLASIWTDSDEGTKAQAAFAARARLLRDVLAYFGIAYAVDPSGVPAAGLFSAANHPNPFNPATRISFNLPRASRLGVKVYDLRGQLVRVLADERREAGPGFVTWDGSRDGGAPAASGVYFYEVRAGAEVIVGKMALIK